MKTIKSLIEEVRIIRDKFDDVEQNYNIGIITFNEKVCQLTHLMGQYEDIKKELNEDHDFNSVALSYVIEHN